MLLLPSAVFACEGSYTRDILSLLSTVFFIMSMALLLLFMIKVSRYKHFQFGILFYVMLASLSAYICITSLAHYSNEKYKSSDEYKAIQECKESCRSNSTCLCNPVC